MLSSIFLSLSFSCLAIVVLTLVFEKLDGVHEEATDKFYIIELNDSACGFVERHTAEDMVHVRDLVLSTARRALLNAISTGPVKI